VQRAVLEHTRSLVEADADQGEEGAGAVRAGGRAACGLCEARTRRNPFAQERPHGLLALVESRGPELLHERRKAIRHVTIIAESGLRALL
jgi:hypothetical protein